MSEVENEIYAKWIIVDLGTLADDSHRIPLIPDWDAYHENSIHDQAFANVVQLVKELSENHPLLIITERNEEYRGITEKWLNKTGISYDELIMRPIDNFMTAIELKLNFLQSAFKEITEEVFLVIDDSDKAVEMWRNNNLFCIQLRIKS